MLKDYQVHSKIKNKDKSIALIKFRGSQVDTVVEVHNFDLKKKLLQDK